MKDLHNIILNNLELNNLLNWNSDLGLQNECDDDFVYIGWIQKYDFLRGYGFVADLTNNEEHFFHYSEIGEDLYSCDHINIQNLVLDHLLSQLRFQFQKTNEWKALKKEMRDNNIDNIELSKKSRFGSYKILASKNKEYTEISQYSFSGYPFISPAQIVCFKIQEGKAIGVHNPFFYKYHLLKNKDKYSSTIWNLLFNYIPSLLHSIQYQGVSNLEKDLSSFRENAERYIKQIKQFDIGPYKELDNYNLKLESSYYPTTKDSDPNQLYLVISRKDGLDDEFVTYSTFHVPLTEIVDYYGQASLDYLQHFVDEEYKNEFKNFYDEFNSRRHTVNVDELVEKHFQPIKKKWIDYFITKYTKSEHLKYFLNKLKWEYIGKLKNVCSFYCKDIKPDFFSDGNYVFEFENSLPYYGHKIEIIHKNKYYQLFTYDDTYNGYYKGKHFIDEMFFYNADPDYKKLCDIQTINKELYSYIDSQFDLVIMKCLEELQE